MCQINATTKDQPVNSDVANLCQSVVFPIERKEDEGLHVCIFTSVILHLCVIIAVGGTSSLISLVSGPR